MSKVKFRYNSKSLKYEKVEITLRERILRVLSYLASGLVFAAITIAIAYSYFDSPKEKQLLRERDQLKLQYEILNNKLEQVETVLADIQQRDDNIYRVIFEAEPIPSSIRQAGGGGVNKYSKLSGYENAELIAETGERLDKIARQLVVQSKSFDEVIKLAKSKEVMLKSIPAIQPISNKDLTRIASGFSYRIHPIYKIMHFHTGLDFAAPTGTEIYSTGDGVVRVADAESRGYGNHIVIDHGYGYQTLYGHLSRYAVRPGQKVKRGEIIGYVGSTGTSTAPHLHYEVIKGGEKINPINFFYNDLSPADYEKVLELASKSNQSFD
ncbi:MAG: M23 family metallopeptidase [Bacteroidia bacterium]|nr:M23 family metallopeptidase [Bacteroidia bacterium]